MSNELIKDEACRLAFNEARQNRFGVHRLDVVCEPDIFRSGYAAALKTQPSGVDERAALILAANRLDRLVLEVQGGYWRGTVSEWAAEARAALTASAPSHGEQVRQMVPSVQITGHLDEVDAPVWEFINAEARKLGPITGSIDSYGLSRPNGGQPNGGVVVLWNGPKIHAVALAVRDAMNRTMCIRLLAAAQSAGSQGGAE